MSYLLDISTAIPPYAVSKEELIHFYARALSTVDSDVNIKKLNLLNERTQIKTRYSCIPDFKGHKQELFKDGNYLPSVEKRTSVYKEHVRPLASKALDNLFLQTGILPKEVTHLITVSCTGIFAPGIEFLLAEQFGLQHTEKLALNFLGCYAALKALKHAHYIAEAEPNACILIVSAELCSLHFYPSQLDEDIVSNLLFSDGASAAFVCGKNSPHLQNKVVLNIDGIGSAYIPGTMDLMTWNISSDAFRMHLGKEIVTALKDNIRPVVTEFLNEDIKETDFWAIHPGGIKIIHAVKESLDLSEEGVSDSLNVLNNYGNMSSPTILFILNRILNRIRMSPKDTHKKIFSCAFGPGLNIEMIRLSATNTAHKNKLTYTVKDHALRD